MKMSSSFLRLTAAFKLAALACVVLLLTPGNVITRATATTVADNFKVTTVYLVRHAEKAATPPADPPLTDAGTARAQGLARILEKAGIKAIYASQYLRTKHTAEPLAQRLGIPSTIIPIKMDTMSPNVIPPQYLKDVVDRIYANSGDNVLIVGHSNTIPALIKELEGDIVPTIAETEYGDLFVVTVYKKGKAKVAHLKQ